MLSRAVQNFQPPPPTRKDKVASFAPTNTSTATLEAVLKSARQSSQKSVGGFTKYTNPHPKPHVADLRSAGEGKITSTAWGTSGLKRTSSQMRGIVETLHSSDSFQDSSEVIDLTPMDVASVRTAFPVKPAFEFDPNDFEDDSDLDLDLEYPDVFVSNAPTQTTVARVLPPASSAQTWSSSPPSHKITPPGALRRRETEQAAKASVVLLSSEASIDANPQPAKKRRTLPWLQQQAQELARTQQAAGANAENISSSTSDDSDFRHQDREEMKSHKDFTPLRKDASLPWNTTHSAIKQQQKAFKNLQKKPPKLNDISMEDMQDAIRTSNQAKPTPVCLSDEQNKVLDLVINKKKSVFFTGSAGTGKSVLMRAIIADLRKMYIKEPDRVAVTASTGLAACNIGGVTLHSFSGIGLGKESTEVLVKKIMRNQKARNRWIRTKVLIIDEISMVDGELFDKLEAIARRIRKNGRSFGGIQLVITGDFFQLPPVPDSGKRDVKFAFDAGTWSTTIDHTIGLTEVFRQKDPGRSSQNGSNEY